MNVRGSYTIMNLNMSSTSVSKTGRFHERLSEKNTKRWNYYDMNVRSIFVSRAKNIFQQTETERNENVTL